MCEIIISYLLSISSQSISLCLLYDHTLGAGMQIADRDARLTHVDTEELMQPRDDHAET